MNRYITQVQVVRTETRVNWRAVGADIRSAITTKVQAVQAQAQTIARRFQVAGIAAAVGIAIALETYKTLA